MSNTGGGTTIFYAETAVSQLNNQWLVDVSKDIHALLPQMLPVTNNSPTTVGGGGTPRASPAPPLAGNATAASSLAPTLWHPMNYLISSLY